MDPERNPFAPGAGNPPPELAGREDILDDVRVSMGRLARGRHTRGQLLLGLRGVGKTVLLNQIETLADAANFLTVAIEAPGADKLGSLLVPRLRSVLLKLSTKDNAKDIARHALRVLQAFASTLTVSVGGMDVGVVEPTGTADSGDLELDLTDLLVEIGTVARAAGTAVVIVIDEVQYLSRRELSALIVAIHKVSQKQLPVMLFGGGLPQLAGLVGDAKSYAERLFQFPEVGALSRDAAIRAIRKPLESENVAITDDALEAMLDATKAYPYFLQEWGFHAWNAARESPITAQDVAAATVSALTRLDSDFFKVRFNRLTPREKDYMRAMAELGPGSHRSGTIASMLGLDTMDVTHLRNTLMNKGMIYSRRYGQSEFTVPMFDTFMRRVMPDWLPGRHEDDGRDADESISPRAIPVRLTSQATVIPPSHETPGQPSKGRGKRAR